MLDALRTRIPVVPPLFIAFATSGYYHILNAVTGVPVIAYLLNRFQNAARKGISINGFYCLAPDGSSLKKVTVNLLFFRLSILTH